MSDKKQALPRPIPPGELGDIARELRARLPGHVTAAELDDWASRLKAIQERGEPENELLEKFKQFVWVSRGFVGTIYSTRPDHPDAERYWKRVELEDGADA